MRIDIELLRIISAMGIIWFHSGNLQGREIAYSGLVFFVIISAYFATVSPKLNRPLSRVKRLIIPCIIWSIFYGGLNLIGKGQVCPENYNLFSCILSTPSTHLWYLPYMYVVLIFIDRIKLTNSKKSMGIVAGLGAIALILSAPIWRTFNYLPPFDLYLHALPEVLIGIFLGCYHYIKAKFRWLILSGVILSILIMVSILPIGIGIPYLFGTIPSLLVLREDLCQKYQFNICSLSSLMYGVYLIHFAFFLILWSVGIKNYGLPLIVFLLSLISIFALKKLLPKKLYKYVA